MTQTTRIGKQKNPALLTDTDLGAGGRTTGTGYPLILQGLRAVISAIGWDRVDTIAAAIRTRYAALLAVPTRLGQTGAAINNLAPRVGNKLGLVLPPYDGVPLPALTYQWVRDVNTAIAGATAAQYTVQAADLAFTLKCTVTVTNSQGNISETTATTAAVLAAL